MEIRNIKKRYNKEGIRYLMSLANIISCYFLSFFKDKYFYFNGKKYLYFYHKYNHTWFNERAIEIPLIMEEIKKTKGEILEIGNVLKHYYSLDHDVVDKYEKSKGIINEDVEDFKLKKRYDLIVSISTLEHVGWDEKIKDSKKIVKAVKNMKKHLKNYGRIITTVPIGHNPFLQKIIDENNENKLFDETYFFRRKFLNRWEKCRWEDIKNYKYSVNNAEAIAILIIKK